MKAVLSSPNMRVTYDDGCYFCPHCQEKYYDGNKFYKRIERNKTMCAYRRCDKCGRRFGLTDNPMSGLVGFE